MQRLALHQLHHDIQRAFALSDFVDGADVGMGKGGRCPGFMKQILAGGGIHGRIFLDDFHGHVTMQHFVVGAIDDPHPPFANLR